MITFQPPAGGRDLFPLDVAQKSWIRERLQEVCQRWGYQRIITPTLERLETLVAGGAIHPRAVVTLQDGEGTLGLRPDLTASIARAAASHLSPWHYPQRFYYIATVFRPHPRDGHCLEQYQAGVELLGAKGLLADAEVLLLLVDCLEALGLTSWQLLLGDAGLTQALLLPFPVSWRPQVRTCLAELDRTGLRRLNLPPDLHNLALRLFDLRGRPAEVLAQLATWETSPELQTRLVGLEDLVSLLPSHLNVVLDLSLIQTFDYYTGLVFSAVSEGSSPALLGQGGRYDDLVGIYDPAGRSQPGIGFSLRMEEIQSWLVKHNHLMQESPPSDWLVVPLTPEAGRPALAHAQHLRQQHPHLRVELELLSQPPEQVRAQAQRRRIAQIAWVTASEIQTEIVTYNP